MAWFAAIFSASICSLLNAYLKTNILKSNIVRGLVARKFWCAICSTILGIG